MEWGSNLCASFQEDIKAKRLCGRTEAFPKASQYPLPMEYKKVVAIIPFPEG
jgi:hypothetical protein